jgi:hypothetical protein
MGIRSAWVKSQGMIANKKHTCQQQVANQFQHKYPVSG